MRHFEVTIPRYIKIIRREWPNGLRDWLRDFFSQWTGGKKKLRLEKPTVNISKGTISKNKKLRRGTLREKLKLDLYFIYRKH